jgi:hypothetical protein
MRKAYDYIPDPGLYTSSGASQHYIRVRLASPEGAMVLKTMAVRED